MGGGGGQWGSHGVNGGRGPQAHPHSYATALFHLFFIFLYIYASFRQSSDCRSVSPVIQYTRQLDNHVIS